MNSKLIISYSGPNPKKDSDIDLKSLGKSLIGLDMTIQKLLRVVKIRGDIEVKATKINKGSIEVEIMIYFFQNFPFESVESLMKIIQFCDHSLFSDLNDYWNTLYTNSIESINKLSFEKLWEDIVHVRSQTNEFLKENADVNILVGILLSFLLPKLFEWGKKQKESPLAHDSVLGNMPNEYAIGLHKMIQNKGFHKTLKPFIDQEFEKIEIYSSEARNDKTVIDGGNFDRYLSGLSEILPSFINGQKYWIRGSILNYQSARGDSMKLRLEGVQKKHQLVTLYPSDGKTTKDYIDFYQEDCNVFVEVVRKSIYQKPQFILYEINLQQEPLFNS